MATHIYKSRENCQLTTWAIDISRVRGGNERPPVSPRPENRPYATSILPERRLPRLITWVRRTGMGWCSRQAAAGRPRRESGSSRD